MSALWPVAVIAGACIAMQAAMNARLGQLLKSSWLATSYAFLTSFILVSLVLLVINAKTLSVTLQNVQLSTVPWYLWGSCVLSVLGVGSMYWLIPKMGVGNLMSYALTGQIIFAMLISHFGLFDSPQKLISITKALGTVLLIAGIVLINKD